MTMHATATQGSRDHRSAARVAMAAVIFVSGLALGAALGKSVATVAEQASVGAPGQHAPAPVYRAYRSGGTGLGKTTGDAREGFDKAHHVGQAAESRPNLAALDAIRFQRRAEFGVGGP